MTDTAVTYILDLIRADSAAGLFDSGAAIYSLSDAAEYVDANEYLWEAAIGLGLPDSVELAELAEAVDAALELSPIVAP